MNTLAAVAQILVAAAFASIPLLRHRFGGVAKAAAVAELERQGVRPAVLEENRLRFDASGHEWWAPGSFAAALLTAAVLTLAGNPWGTTLTWVFSSIALLANIAVLQSQLGAVKSVRAAFRRKGDPELLRVDVPAFLKAAEGAFPSWTRALQNVRHTVVFAGSALALTAAALV
ncbi:hypothetical protein [Streptomyces albireticuli]|uniref:Uncharacterized protein n=1 Tax=Streptomyces albireticuli TaxID=1940 RepID=A0A2A2D7Q3_9ACTN|nr:hypothetical protein [Streptomyces albireticuli]MCD9145143.1 hypothetical protein [Streptomyces albireticuli]MCD9164682.1 hypothetical protein [Streptomyces albireticuli]MCD9194947.1 hypothetical protein [Streptomyces albireticuli]PAU47399.1 hypothetical protein CK936_18945 [Streptomyces albireticuli]